MLNTITKERRNLILEWLFWCVLVAVLWAQTGSFSETITEYKFGADGWPKVVLLGLLIGATGQLVLGYVGLNPASETEEATAKKNISRKQQIAIFIVPLLYLWLMHRIGFFVATPIFIATYLLVLEVKNWRYIVGVTAFIYVFILLLFVRFFYVALPVGAWQFFYDISNTIITIVRIGT